MSQAGGPLRRSSARELSRARGVSTRLDCYAPSVTRRRCHALGQDFGPLAQGQTRREARPFLLAAFSPEVLAPVGVLFSCPRSSQRQKEFSLELRKSGCPQVEVVGCSRQEWVSSSGVVPPLLKWGGASSSGVVPQVGWWGALVRWWVVVSSPPRNGKGAFVAKWVSSGGDGGGGGGGGVMVALAAPRNGRRSSGSSSARVEVVG